MEKLKKVFLISIFTIFTFVAALSPFVALDSAYATVEDLFSYVTNPFKSSVEPYGGKLIKKSYNEYNGHRMYYEIRSTHLSPSTVVNSYENTLKSKNIDYKVSYKNPKDITIGFPSGDYITVINVMKDDLHNKTFVQKSWRLSKDSNSCGPEINSPIDTERYLKIVEIENDFLREQLLLEFSEELDIYSSNFKKDVGGEDIPSIDRYPSSVRTNTVVFDAGKIRKVSYSNNFSIKANESYYLTMMNRNGWNGTNLLNRINKSIDDDSRHFTFEKNNQKCSLFILKNDNNSTVSTFLLR